MQKQLFGAFLFLPKLGEVGSIRILGLIPIVGRQAANAVLPGRFQFLKSLFQCYLRGFGFFQRLFTLGARPLRCFARQLVILARLVESQFGFLFFNLPASTLPIGFFEIGLTLLQFLCQVLAFLYGVFGRKLLAAPTAHAAAGYGVETILFFARLIALCFGLSDGFLRLMELVFGLG